VTARGSGRGVPGVDLVAALQACHELLGGYGGHPMAVGVSLPVANVEAFRARFAAAVAAQLARGAPVAGPSVDIAHWLSPEQVTDRVLDELEMLQPFGEGNPEPVFGFRGFRFDRLVQRFGDNEANFRHALVLPAGRRLAFVAWRMADRAPEPGRPVDLAVRLGWNRWQGRRTAQAEIIDWRPSGPA